MIKSLLLMLMLANVVIILSSVGLASMFYLLAEIRLERRYKVLHRLGNI